MASPDSLLTGFMHPIEERAVDSPSRYVAQQAHDYLASDGAEVEHPHADNLILLYVTGRSTGTIRRVPLVAVRDDDSLLIVGSKGGAPDHPSWYLNLAANPQVWVRHKAEFFEARAGTLEGDQRAAAWAEIVAVMPFFDEYRTRTERELPVVRLTPAEPPEA